TRALVFTRTKHGANKLVKLLARADIEALAIHGNKTQSAREKALASFKAGKVKILIATDIAARGIDVEGISHVINHDIPNIAETYVHRIGRTARAGSGGISISLCSPEEHMFIRDIEKLIKQPIPVVDERPYLTRVELKPVEPRPQKQSKPSQKRNKHKPRNPQSQRRPKQRGQASPGSKARRGNYNR
ncbi:MAG: C-terminal helicase domain-containing protein, partial [Thermoplasmata archaeon]|nr:C-terminal helicase domain-containing protein [Thermoplasmata archaeon]